MERNLIPPYTSELNGIAEGASCTLVESARAVLYHGKIPMRFWAEAVAHAAYIRNRFLSPQNDYKTSYELPTGRTPRVDHIWVLDSSAWTLIPKAKRAKLDPKSTEGKIMGCYDNGLYKVWIRSTGKPILTKNVKILENRFPPQDLYSSKTSESSENADLELVSYKYDSETEPDVVEDTSSDLARGSVTDSQLESLTHYPPHSASNPEKTPIKSPVIHSNMSETYSSRERKATSFFEPSMAIVAPTELEPNSVGEALKSSEAVHWKAAMNSELISLEMHNTWKASKVPSGMKPFSTGLVFQRRRHSDGTIARYKTRLVVRGLVQGDFDYT